MQTRGVKMRKVPYGHWRCIAMGLLAGLGVLAVAYGATTPPVLADAPFMAENKAAMDTMMTNMDVKPTGDADQDFVAMMVPHHQGAIDMARAELRHGHNQQLRRIAQEIIVDQQQEIVAMRLALGQPLPSPVGNGKAK